jgi:hypothetical protein
VGVGGTAGRTGSVLGDWEEVPDWFGFHILVVFPFIFSGMSRCNPPGILRPLETYAG